MKNINEKIDKYLKEANVEDYDISDEVQEALDELKDLAKLTGGTFSGEHAVINIARKSKVTGMREIANSLKGIVAFPKRIRIANK